MKTMLKFNPCHIEAGRSWEGPLWEILYYTVYIFKGWSLLYNIYNTQSAAVAHVPSTTHPFS